MQKEAPKELALILVMAVFLSAVVGGASLLRAAESGYAGSPESP
jgi:hypothetical protein